MFNKEKKKYYSLVDGSSTLIRITNNTGTKQSAEIKNIQRISSINKCSYTHMTHSACSVNVELQYPLLKLHVTS